MPTYEKINTLYKRQMEGANKGKIIEGDYSKEEFTMIDQWEVTEKIDGTNIRIEFVPWDLEGSFSVPHFAGRTDKAIIPEPLKTNLAKHFEAIDITEVFDFSKADSITLYCEGFGVGIQKGGKYISDNQDFILYDILIDGIWLEREKVKEFAEQLNIEMVPCFGIMSTEEIVELVKAETTSSFGDFPFEGVVCRSKPLLLDRMGRRVVWKLKIIDFK